MIELRKKCSVKDCHHPIKAKTFCQKHYMRWRRNGHEYDTRPSDWGSREKHPLYIIYCSMCRYHRKNMCTKWHDFWGFIEDIKSKPATGNCQLYRKDPNKEWCLENVYWKERGFAPGNEKEYQKVYRKNNMRKCHNRELRRRYGIGIEEYDRLLSVQNGVCAICARAEVCVDSRTKKIRRLALDHCHDSNKVRGLLCTDCNSGLGRFKDNVELLKAAIKYLQSHAT